MESDDLLDELGILGGTDKCSLCHDYLRHYQRILLPLRDAVINVVEIGVDRGGSLRMWAAFFSRATLVGIDIRPQCRQYAGDRQIIEIGSQEDPDFLNNIGIQYSPTLVIDDGSH